MLLRLGWVLGLGGLRLGLAVMLGLGLGLGPGPGLDLLVWVVERLLFRGPWRTRRESACE